MSSLVLDLQREALDSRSSIGDLLRKAVVVAKKLNVREFDTWASNELSGYRSGAELPPYRTIHGHVKAWNPYHGWIPVVLPAQLAELLSSRKNNQGVAELENLLAGGAEGELQMPFDKSTEERLMTDMSGPKLIPTLIVPRTSIVRILDSVRNIVLNWALQLEQDGILGEGLSFSDAERSTAASHTYNITHFHGTVTGSQIQQFSPNATQTKSDGLDLVALAAFVEKVREVLPQLGLEPQQQDGLSADLATIETQAKSPTPKNPILKEALRSVRAVVEQSAGSLLASGILAEIQKLLG